EGAGVVGVAGDDVLVKLDPQPRTFGQHEVAVFELQGFALDVVEPGVAAAVFEHQEVGCGGGQLDGRGGRDRAERVVGRQALAVQLGMGGDAADLRDASGVADVR